ncbi:MAG: 30S ribosomal protein S16 [Candidatus Gribaldobacteria bacterium]|nr:30S ribosomal protein S16 [Candidatus Gribaldobacteria bacterium]
MLSIRFFRTGKKNQPFFKVVVCDRRNAARGGRFLEVLGFYNPKTKEKQIKKERVEYWLGCGAKATATVHNLLVKEGTVKGVKIAKHKKSKKPEEPKPTPASAEATAGKEVKPAKPATEEPVVATTGEEKAE